MDTARPLHVASPQIYSRHVASSQEIPQNVPSRTTEGPKTQEWEALKEEIRGLYEQHPLKEVRRRLELRGFFAT
jgi:hypothetical protein